MELLTTPSFYTDLLEIPFKDQKKFTKAVKIIQSDPFVGSGKAKKCFKHKFSNVYRYRIGNHRIIYCVGGKCIKLLTVGKRNDIYERFEADPDVDIGADFDLSEAQPIPIQTMHFDKPRIVNPARGEDTYEPEEFETPDQEGRSRKLLKELLKQWNVPKKDINEIINCTKIEEILDLDIEDRIKDIVLRWDQPSKINQIIEEPVYDVPSVEYLEKYLEGSLKGFLLKLDPDQEKVARKNLSGPTLVKGGPGSGKSLIALYRIRNLMTQDAQKKLFNESPPRTLFVTYTTTLIRASKQLLEPLIGKSIKHVKVNNLDKIVRSSLARAEITFNPANEKHKKDALKDAIEKCRKHDAAKEVSLNKLLNRASHEYLIAEFDWIIEGREIGDIETYLQEDRTGRGIPFDAETRKVVWTLHEWYLKSLDNNERKTWNQLRSMALQALTKINVKAQPYDIVIVDEAQDLTPVGLRMCMALCKNPKGFYMTADSGQSIYNRGFSWKRVDETIKVRGRTTILKYNYRSTRQIMEASLQPLRDNGGGDPETFAPIPVREGSNPKLIACTSVDDQIKQTAQFIRESARETRLPFYSGAVLVRSNKAGEEFAKGLSNMGLNAELVKGTTFNLDDKVIKVMTIHSAKGLEFPFVVVARVDAGLMPLIWDVKNEEERKARIEEERRLLSVGLTRAMRRMALVFDKNRLSSLIKEFDKSLWS